MCTKPVANTWDDKTEFAGVKSNRVRYPSEKIMFADAMTPQLQPQHSQHYFRVSGYDDHRAADDTAYVAYRHSGSHEQVNVAFWDGHVETKDRGDIAAVVDPNIIDANGLVGNRTGAWEKRWELVTR